MSTMVRLPLVWTEFEKLSEDEELEYNALGKNPSSFTEKGTIVLDLEFVCGWFKDGESTIIDLKNGKRFNISLPEDQFTMLFTDVTKNLITEVKFTEVSEEEENKEEDDGTNYMGI